MRQLLLAISLLFSALAAMAQGKVSFSATDFKPVEVTPDAASGLQAVYVLHSASGVSVSYTAESGSASWQRFSNLGGGFAEDITPQRQGSTSSVVLTGDMGYIITDGSSRLCFWVVDYSAHSLDLRSLAPSGEQECDRASLHLDGDAAPITYFTVNGAPRTLSRELQLAYTTLAFDAESRTYRQEEKSLDLASVAGDIHVPDVWCDTRFTLSGDRFLTAWGMPQSVESDLFKAISVSAETSAVMAERDAENEQPVEGGALGGSAPVDITFSAAVTDAAVFTEWEIASDAEFEHVDDRYSQTEFEYSFRETGTKYVRFNCADASGRCTFTSDTYEVYVGESALLCPNAFSPLNDDGVNDEWRVSYKSIIDFDCHIFNRWGKELAHLTSPSQGWNGTSGSKKVPAGVYFYVIKATGSDGKEYNLSGHINIVGQGSRLPGAPSDPAEGE